MQDITVLITAHLRPVSLKQSLRSVRRYYPDIPIIVITDARLTADAVKKIHEANALLIIEKEDAGLSAMRNNAIKAAKTPYVMVIEDDMTFTAETDLSKLKAVLEANPKVALAAGSLISEHDKRDFINKLKINYVAREYEIIEIRDPEWFKTPCGVKYCYADYTYNFFLIRKAAGLYWDDELKIGIEHIDFFLRLKENHPEWKAACVPEVVAGHRRSHPNIKYFVNRHRKDFWLRFNRKTGFAKGINLNAKQVYDIENNRTLPYPEYVFFLLKNKKYVSPEVLKPSIYRARRTGG